MDELEYNMKKQHTNKITKKIVQAAALSFLMASSTHALAETNVDHADKMEKCYGIVKKGMNDCQTKTASCAGSATKDNQKDAFIFLPKGDCEKIVGGSLTQGDDDSK